MANDSNDFDADSEGSRVTGTVFSVIPEAVLDAPISDRAYRLYGLLARYVGTDGRVFPTRRTLAERLGCSEASVDRALKDLVDNGFLLIEHCYRKDGSLTSSNYHLQGHPTPATQQGGTLSAEGRYPHGCSSKKERDKGKEIKLKQETKGKISSSAKNQGDGSQKQEAAEEGSEMSNRAAYRALRDAEDKQILPPLEIATRAGIAKALTELAAPDDFNEHILAAAELIDHDFYGPHAAFMVVLGEAYKYAEAAFSR